MICIVIIIITIIIIIIIIIVITFSIKYCIGPKNRPRDFDESLRFEGH